MTTKEQKIEALYADLSQASLESDDAKCLSLCDELIKLGDQAVPLQAKVVSLIRLDRYDEALALIGRKLKGVQVNLNVEKLYCYYRTNQWKQALDLLATVKQEHPDAPAVLLLEAQLCYAQDDFEQAIDIYTRLLPRYERNDPMHEEIQANILAAQAGLAYTATNAPNVQLDTRHASYELSYNAASLLLAQDDEDSAIRHLKTARDQCTERLREEGVAQREIDEELAIMTTQLAYAYQLQGQVQKAMDTYQDIVTSKVQNGAVNAVVANNLVTLQGTNDLFDVAKKLKAASTKEADAKLQQYQKRVVRMNEALLQMYMNKHASSKDMVQRLLAQYPDMEEMHVLMASVTAHQQQKQDKAIAELKVASKDHPTSIALRFATIQYELLASQTQQALETLEAYLRAVEGDAAKVYRPGVVALRVWLHEQTGQADRAMQLLEDASNHWAASGAAHKAPTAILKQTAAFKLKTGRFADATRDYEQLVKADPTDVQSLAGLIAAYAETHPDKAKQYSDALPPIASSTILDVDALEEIVPGVKKGYVKKTSDAKHATAKTSKTKNKKRAPLLPQNYDASKQPDPERWLPKQERSDYKPKKGKKASGSQGVAVEGGGIGMTGSARIAGVQPAQDTAAEDNDDNVPSPKEEPKKQQQQPATSNKSNKNKKGGKKKGGKNKW